MTIDEHITAAVHAGIEEALAPYLRRLIDPEPLVYSVPQAAKVLGTSPDTVRRLVAEGHLALVPHMGERKLIPRVAVEALVAEALPSGIRRKLEAAS